MARLWLGRITVGLMFAVILIVLNQNCAKFSPQTASSSSEPAVTATELNQQVTALSTDAVVSHLLKLSSSDGSVYYAQWIPALNANGPAPVVLVAAPYDGVAWSDDAIDKQWVQRTNSVSGLYPDINGPNYSATSSQPISYYVTPPDLYSKLWYPLIKSGIGILVVYPRFYAGGNFTTYVKAIAAGFNYLSHHPSVDPTRMGVFGISLGGMEAIYGAHQTQTPPQYGVAWSALSDVAFERNYMQSEPAQLNATAAANFRAFAEPYLRRLPADTSSLTVSSLSPLRTQFLVIHDDWDRLTPSPMARSFVAQAGNGTEGFWFPHLTPINPNTFALDHQQSSEGLLQSMGYLFTYAYFEQRLLSSSSPALLAFFSAADSAKEFTYFQTQQAGGSDIRSLTPRLLDLCDPRLTLADPSSSTVISGPDFVVQVLQTYFGAPGTVNRDNVKLYLQQHQ